MGSALLRWRRVARTCGDWPLYCPPIKGAEGGKNQKELKRARATDTRPVSLMHVQCCALLHAATQAAYLRSHCTHRSSGPHCQKANVRAGLANWHEKAEPPHDSASKNSLETPTKTPCVAWEPEGRNAVSPAADRPPFQQQINR